MFSFAGIVRHFIENGGFGDLPKINKYKKYGAINAGCVRICIASIVAVAHSPFYTGEYYSKLSPLWQKIAQKVKPTYKVVLRSAVDDLIGSPGILWRPIILPNCYKYLVNSETDVFEDTSIMPWHNFPNVQIHRQPLPITRQLPSIAKSFRDIAVQTHELAAVVATTTSEAQTDAESDNRKNRVRIRDRKTFKLEIRNREVMKVFNKLMERELHRFAAANGDNDENPEQMSDELLATNQWFPVVSIKRSRSIENLMSADGADENGPTKKRKMRNTIN